MRKIVYNAIKTPLGVIIPSFNRHDYRTYTENGVEYIIDGGWDYVRCSEVGKTLTIYLDDPFEVVRCFYHRWNHRKKEYVALKDIDDDWLESIIAWYLDSGHSFDTDYFNLYIMEKQYRNEKEY